MKVFTVGLDEKEKAKKSENTSTDMTKIPIDSSASTPAPSPAPIIIPRGPPRRHKGCGVLTWVISAFFVVVLFLTISEIAYNRQRDEAFLRLKWAELRQRMLGYELLSQQQNQQMDERLAFSRRNDAEALPLKETPTEKPDQTNVGDSENSVGDVRFNFLRSLLDRMRQKAADLGLDGDMQIHVIEVKPQQETNNEHMDDRAWQDSFGEVAMPKQFFGPHQREEDYQDYDNFNTASDQWPQQFDRESFRPLNWQENQRFNQWQPSWEAGPFQSFQDAQNNNQQQFMFNDNTPYGAQNMAPQPFYQPQWFPSNQFAANPWQQQQPNTFSQIPSIVTAGQQSQFPFPAQNQAPIQPETNERPWYMGGDDKEWAQTWDNEWKNNDDTPFQPHPSASVDSVPFAPIQWIDQSAGEVNEGIDNFPKKERFNVPLEIESDATPIQVGTKGSDFKVNAWQHTQPASAEDTEPAVLPVNDAPAEDFLPIRNQDIDTPRMDQIVDFHKKFNSPFFQVDDPSSFRK